MEEKNNLPYQIETCRAKTQTFFSNIGNSMVYVSVTMQELPKKISPPNCGNHKSVGEFLKFLAEFIDQRPIAESFNQCASQS